MKMNKTTRREINGLYVAATICFVFILGIIAMVIFVKPTNSCLEWAEDYDLDGEVCWGYGEDEREFAPANQELTQTEFEEIVTRFYENR